MTNYTTSDTTSDILTDSTDGTPATAETNLKKILDIIDQAIQNEIELQKERTALEKNIKLLENIAEMKKNKLRNLQD